MKVTDNDKKNSISQKILEYIDTVKSQVDEDYNLGHISTNQYKYLSDNILQLTISCYNNLNDTIETDEELRLIEKNIRSMLNKVSYIDEECEEEI